MLLDNNNLEELPRRIFANSSSITVLDLSGNRLRSVPEAVNDLARLQSLALSRNLIESLTELRLSSLWRLQASGNRVLIVDTSGTESFSGTRRFYNRCGYTEEARIRDFWGPGDDKIVFWKAL